jgi:hypothetical protein
MTEEKPWRAARYLMRGQAEWNTAWTDVSQWPDPWAYLQLRLGELEDFEWIEGVPAMSMQQALSGTIKKSLDRNRTYNVAFAQRVRNALALSEKD